MITSCCSNSHLQTYSPGPGEVGGCPFSQSDESHLAHLMDIEDIDVPQRSLIRDLVRVKRYSAACKEYHRSKMLNSLQLTKGEVIEEFKGVTIPKKSPAPHGPEELVKNISHRHVGVKKEMTSLRAVTEIVESVHNSLRYNQQETQYKNERVCSFSNALSKRTFGNNCTDVSDSKRRKFSDNHEEGNIKLDQLEDKPGYNWKQDVTISNEVKIGRLREMEENQTKQQQCLLKSSKMVSASLSKQCLSSGLENKAGLPLGLENDCLSSGLESKSCVNLNEPLVHDSHCDCCRQSVVNQLDDCSAGSKYNLPGRDTGHTSSMDAPVECCRTSEAARRLLDEAFEYEFSRPVDYYYSYKKLLYDLTNLCNKCEV